MSHPPCRLFARSCALRMPIAALLAPLSLTSCDGASPTPRDDGAIVRSYRIDDGALDPEVASGLAIASVVGRGRGCPADDFHAEVTGDGKSFRVRLVGYEAQIDDTQSHAGSDCTLSLALRSRVPVAFAVKSVAYIGFAYLDPGVRARFSTRPYFPDGPHQARGSALELLGPFDDEFEQQTESESLSWSPCGVERAVAIDTSVSVRNGAPRGFGFISIGEAEGALPGAVDTARFGITFAVRTCGDSVDAGAPTPPTRHDAGAPDAAASHDPSAVGIDAAVPATERDLSDTKYTESN